MQKHSTAMAFGSVNGVYKMFVTIKKRERKRSVVLACLRKPLACSGERVCANNIQTAQKTHLNSHVSNHHTLVFQWKSFKKLFSTK